MSRQKSTLPPKVLKDMRNKSCRAIIGRKGCLDLSILLRYLQGASPTKKRPSVESSNDPFASEDSFGIGIDATKDGFGDATHVDG
jgi:hypothetical protein